MRTVFLKIRGPALSLDNRQPENFQFGRGRPALHHVLDDWLPAVEQLRPGHGVRWSLDVDPQEMA